MKNLFVIRGVPGAGKSTLGGLIAGVSLSADDYFYNDNGEYVYDSNKIKKAHEWCFHKCERNMLNGVKKIAVCNTFIKEWEFNKYTRLAENYGYTVHTMIVESRHGGINKHSVPDDVIERMKKNIDIKL